MFLFDDLVMYRSIIMINLTFKSLKKEKLEVFMFILTNMDKWLLKVVAAL